MAAAHADRLQLPEELGYRQARECLARLQPRVAGFGGAEVPIDASAVKSFDSAALAVLLALRRTALAAGKQLVVVGLPQGLVSMARLYGVIDLLAQG